MNKGEGVKNLVPPWDLYYNLVGEARNEKQEYITHSMLDHSKCCR